MTDKITSHNQNANKLNVWKIHCRRKLDTIWIYQYKKDSLITTKTFIYKLEIIKKENLFVYTFLKIQNKINSCVSKRKKQSLNQS